MHIPAEGRHPAQQTQNTGISIFKAHLHKSGKAGVMEGPPAGNKAVCTKCGGTGLATCPKCGKVFDLGNPDDEPCSQCSETGWVMCDDCLGSGWILQ
jgi:hypothetical protein